MTIHECDMLLEVSNLIAKCPAPSTNIYALAGYINACRDYGTINKYVIEILTNYNEYINYKRLVRSGEVTREDANYYKERSETALQSLRDFIKRRSEEHWS